MKQWAKMGCFKKQSSIGVLLKQVPWEISQNSREKCHLLRFNELPTLTIESPLKMMKNAFYFMLKAFSFLRNLYYCPDYLVM